MIITERGFKKPAETEPYAVKDSNDNVDKLEEVLDAVDIEMDQLFQSVSNGKALVAGAITDKGVNTSPTDTFAVMAGKIDTIVTDPSIGTTDAVAGDILLGKKVVSQGNLLTGTMPNNGPAVAETVNLTNHNQEYTIAAGSHSGLRKIKAVITNLAAGVIKAGVTVGGILGTFTSDATAAAGDILSGITAYVNGNKVTGTMVDRGTVNATLTTQGQQFTIAGGKHSGLGKIIVNIVNLIAENIKNGVNVGGVVGTYKGETIVTAGNLLGVASSNNTPSVYNTTVYTKRREIRVDIPGTFRVSVGNINGGYSPYLEATLYARIYVNGVARGAVHSGVSFVAGYIEEFTLNAGDLVQLYINTGGEGTRDNGMGISCTINNLATLGAVTL